MRFRPCIDIHNGEVKQIVGGSLKDEGDSAKENFVSLVDSAYYASLYKDMGLSGGHVIILNNKDSEFYEASVAMALKALREAPGTLMIGGGINPLNALSYLDAGASHVIVTSYVFKDGRVCKDALKEMTDKVSKDRLVLDLSVRERDGKYFIVTNRWQCFTDEELTPKLLNELSQSCDEFLVHASDVEGKQNGVCEDVIKILSKSPIPVTYAGGIHSLSDIRLIRELGEGRVDFTVGSALKIFGGSLELKDVIEA